MDVFISYEHESKPIADTVCSVLESKGVRCWYAPRDIYGDYATSIVDAIEKCKVFVLILNHSSSESPHVLNEVEMAYKRILSGEIAIIPFKVDDGILSKAMEYYVKRLHWIDAVSIPLEKSINKLYEQLSPILGLSPTNTPSEEETNLKRKTNQYYSYEDLVEVERLSKEEAFLYDIEQPYYDKLLFKKTDVNVIDIDVLTPAYSIKRFNRPEVAKAAYFSYDMHSVNEGNELCENDPDSKFFHLNLKELDFDEIVTTAMKELNIDGFDFINLTLAIMNFDNPFKILKKLKKYMKPGAVAFVRDVDDTVVFAYPDNEKLFSEFFNFYKYDTMSGSRHSGRQIYSIMKKLGASDVRLERTGINSSGLTYEKRRLLFDSWFSFIPNDFKQIVKNDPTNAKAKEILAWIEEHFDELEESFFDNNFIFNSGYVIYTVRF